MQLPWLPELLYRPDWPCTGYDTNPSRAAMHNAIVRGFSSSRDWEQIAKSCLAPNFGQTPSGKHTKSYGKSLFFNFELLNQL
jgi:hypothetical protein